MKRLVCGITLLATLALVLTTSRLVRVDHEHPDRLVRLSTLGLVPGTTIRVRQRWPTLIIGVGETVLALDGELGSEIHVQLVTPETVPCKKSR